MATNDINLPTTLLFIRVRKPYTITKQREKWTKEEHEKFLEAIKLYGRAWRRIREHIGTKTAVQIRSHAQKFFSKVDRESDTGKSIEIPPPRPKRKPLHPYPRKLGRRVCTAAVPDHAKLPESSSGTIPSFSEQESGSPVSVLSLLRSDTRGIGNICASPSMSDSENGCCSPTSSALVDGRILALGLETMPGPDHMDPKGIDTSARAQSTSVKLFGRTLVVSNSDDENSARFQVMPSAGAPSLAHISPCSEGYSCRSNAEVFAPLPFWNFFGSRLSPLPFTTTRRDKRAEREAPANATETLTAGKENYSTGASTNSVRNETETETETAIDDVDHSVEGKGDSASQVLRSCSATTYRLKRSRNSAFSPVEATNQYMSKELTECPNIKKLTITGIAAHFGFSG